MSEKQEQKNEDIREFGQVALNNNRENNRISLLTIIGECRCRPSDSITALFAAAGLPVEAIILLSPISSIADMARTATNVVGAAAATTLVAATEGQLDRAVYNGEVEAPAAEAV